MAILSIPTPRQEYGLAVSSSHLVYSEIVAVTSAMRKNSRWSGSSRVTSGGNPQLASSMGLRRTTSGATIGAGGRGDKRESDLMGGFEDLKREMRQVPGERNFANSISVADRRADSSSNISRYSPPPTPNPPFSIPHAYTISTIHWSHHFYRPRLSKDILHLGTHCACVTHGWARTHRAEQRSLASKIRVK